MFYKAKLLKDLPNYKAGTVFKVRDRYDKNGDKIGFYVNNNPHTDLHDIIDDPNWFEKVVDFSYAKKTTCSKCYSTLFFPITKEEAEYNEDQGVYEHFKILISECAYCGHKQEVIKIYTHYTI